MLNSSRYLRRLSSVIPSRHASSAQNDKLFETIKAKRFNKVKLAAVDMDGVLRGKYVSLDKFRSCLDSNLSFCGVIHGWDLHDKLYTSSKVSGQHNGYPDITATIDPKSLRQLPWEEDLPFFLVDFEADKSVNVCPRKVLKKVCKQLEEEVNAKAMCGPELEFFNFAEDAVSWPEKGYKNPKPLTYGMFGYSLLRTGQNSEIFKDIFDECAAFGVPIEGLHTETGPGVFEAAIRFGDAVTAADNATLFKYALKIIGSRHGFMPCFMAKPYSSMPGSSGHIHQSLVCKDTQNNLFHDDNDPNKMSQLFKHYVAGQLHCLPKILPMFCPTVNSYKRLVEGFWAPVEATWGVENRTSSLRVIPGSSKSTRLETRIAGADANTYFSIAASLAAGLYGIRHKLELPAEIVGERKVTPENRLARTLLEAAERMKNSEEAKEMFGEDFVEHFTMTREWEYNEYLASFQDTVTDWEVKRYAEII
uniref:GS catalytic domain-containing protein n=1 Tax=Vannella robusta TaxID=1487602 RepID=A0A7S4M8N9_9EUKA|mmetsp:Transcript_14707/g.18614  ORF Transcript_14707/g.18614 Transcript_14707/m.18614 type:complete len:476 (+) Transcript_14707:95-1522(+)